MQRGRGENMPVSWKPSSIEAHEALAKKTTGQKDPEWEALLDELVRGGAVTIDCQDEKACSTLARSVGRRAGYRGFKTDLRRGAGYLSVRQAGPAPARKGGG
jgi:hypothetical protein